MDGVFRALADPGRRRLLDRNLHGVKIADRTVIHEDFPPASKAAELVSGGWPQVLSKLKTLLETGETFRIEHAAARDV